MKTGRIGIYHDPRKRLPWVVRWYSKQINIETGRQKRYCRSFTTIEKAEEFQSKQRSKFDTGKPRDPNKITLPQYCMVFLEQKRTEVGPKTYRDYEGVAKRMIDYFPVNTLPRDISVGQAKKFFCELESKKDRQLSDWTRNKILRYCRVIFQSAVDDEIIDKNVFRRVKCRKVDLKEWHYIDAGEFEKLLDAAPSHRWKGLYSLAYTAGLRYGELFNLRWVDIDFKQGIVSIKNHPATDTTWPFTTKNRKKRKVPLTQHTKEILLRWQLQQGLGVPYVFLTRKQYERIINKWRKYMDQKRERDWINQDIVHTVTRQFRKHIQDAGIEPNGTLSFHTLRKCSGKNWADRILNPKITQELMGHSSLATTMRFYDKIRNKDVKEAARLIDSFLRSAAKNTPDRYHKEA